MSHLSLSNFRGKSRVSEIMLGSVASQVALGLHYCHTPTATKPIVLHRDIKPENGETFFLQETQRRVSNVNSLVALVMADGSVMLADFGLGKALGLKTTVARSAVGLSRRDSCASSARRLTRRCLIFETPGYQAPVSRSSRRLYSRD